MNTPANEWREEDCPFCPMVFPNNDVLNIEPLNPVVEGHRIFIPRQHVTDFAENAIVSNAVMFQVQQHAQKVGGDFNIITSKGKNATQSVFHLHVHFVPRRENDGLMLPWTGKNLLDQHSAHEEVEADKVFDCFEEGCGECTVCKYLDFIDWAESVGKPEGSTIQRNDLVEDYLKRKAEHLHTHSAHLVERLESLKMTERIGERTGRGAKSVSAVITNQVLDRVKDIIKDNK